MISTGRKVAIAAVIGVTTACAIGPVTASAAPESASTLAAEFAGARGLIVTYKSGAAEATSDRAAAAGVSAAAARTGVDLAAPRRLSTGGVVVDADPTGLAAAAAALLADPRVATVEPNGVVWATAEPNDPLYAKQWHYSEPKGGINAPAAWNTSTGEGVVVAVIDTGYVKHSDLEAAIVPGYDFVSDAKRARDGDGRDANPADEGDWMPKGSCGLFQPPQDYPSSWHGTHVAGTIAASTNNGVGGAGIAYKAKVQPVRVLAQCGGTFADIIDGITWASGGTVSGVPANKTPAQVINMSLGGAAKCSSQVQASIDGAVKRGTTVVVAAGNDGKDAANYTPAGCKNVVTVAATDRDGNRSVFRSDGSFSSNYGTVVDVAAPGGETWTAEGGVNGVLSTLNSGKTKPEAESYAYYQGTSMASPHVAGVAALLKSAKKDLTPAQVEEVLKNTARPLPGECTGGCGKGIVDAAKAVGS